MNLPKLDPRCVLNFNGDHPCIEIAVENFHTFMFVPELKLDVYFDVQTIPCTTLPKVAQAAPWSFAIVTDTKQITCTNIYKTNIIMDYAILTFDTKDLHTNISINIQTEQAIALSKAVSNELLLGSTPSTTKATFLPFGKWVTKEGFKTHLDFDNDDSDDSDDSDD
jgi:hypothetical protein